MVQENLARAYSEFVPQGSRPIRRRLAVGVLERPIHDLNYIRLSEEQPTVSFSISIDGSVIEVVKTSKGKTVFVDGVQVIEDAPIPDASTLIRDLAELGYIADSQF